jgi:hypothetical protein
MPDDNGCAIPSSNSMGYQVVNRIDENRVLIIIEPNGDMIQRVKTEIDDLQNGCKTTVSCETPKLTVNDVSPIEHKCSLRLISDTYETEGSKNVYKFDADNIKIYMSSGGDEGEYFTSTINDDGTVTYDANVGRDGGVYAQFTLRDLTAGETYEFYVNGRSLTNVRLYFTDGSYYDDEYVSAPPTKPISYTFTHQDNIDYYVITCRAYYSYHGDSEGWPSDTLRPQLTLDKEIKPYITDFSTVGVNVNGKTYTPNADGTVTVDSVSPTMEITTNNQNVNIVEFTYNTEDSNTVAGCMGFEIVRAHITYDRDNTQVLCVHIEGNEEDNIDISSVEANRIALGLKNSVSLQWGNNYDLCCNVHKYNGFYMISYDSFKGGTEILLRPVPSNFNESLATSGYIWFPTNPEIGNVRLGTSAHTEGYDNKAVQFASHTEGYHNVAAGKYSHTEGRDTVAVYTAHAEGNGSKALGQGSHAEGYGTNALGQGSHTEGGSTIAEGKYSHAEGEGANASGYRSHAEGGNTKASGKSSHAEGSNSESQGENSHAEGENTEAIGMNSHSEGKGTKAEGIQSHAEGSGTKATKNQSHAEGNCTEATGTSSHTEGNYAKASGKSAHAENNYTSASGEGSHAEGNYTNANGQWSHAEGDKTHANGIGSHTGGGYTQANGDYSFAHGEGVRAQERGQFVCGMWNDFNDVADTVCVVGNGTSSSARSNALKVFKDGHAEVQTMGTTDNSVVTKNYIDNAIGDIETVLDNIIAIQENLIGGGSV